MITEYDLQEAIAECQGVRNPDANTAIMLAAFLTIQREMFGKSEHVEDPDRLTQGEVEALRLIPGQSFAAAPDGTETTIAYDSGTDFGQLIHGRRAAEVWPIMDELVSETVRYLVPRAYDAVMRKLK